jgi:hypothetical protein
VSDFKVDQGVPMPKVYRYPIDELEVGESFEFPIEKRQSVQTSASNIKKKSDKSFVVSKVNDEVGRIWRKG